MTKMKIASEPTGSIKPFQFLFLDRSHPVEWPG
jgi:hypothetical protein